MGNTYRKNMKTPRVLSMTYRVASFLVRFMQYRIWLIFHHTTKAAFQRQRKAEFSYCPLISVIVPVYNTPLRYLHALIRSVRKQSYSNWELCLAVGAGSLRIQKHLAAYAAKDARIQWKMLSENKGIAGNTNEAISLSRGEYIALLDHDDMLDRSALYEVAVAVQHQPEADYLYSDEDKIYAGIRFNPYFKSDFSFEALRRSNCICHLFVLKRGLGERIGWLREGFDGSQDYDLALRAAEKAVCIVHIPKILYHWRVNTTSVAHNPAGKPYAFTAAKKAIKEHLLRMGIPGVVEDGDLPFFYKITDNSGIR